MKFLLTNRWAHTIFLLLMLAGALTGFNVDPPIIKGMRYFAFDTYNKLHPREPTDRVVIVDIDDKSLADERLGQWPWPRPVIGDLVTKLKAAGAKAIVFDMVFAERDRTTPALLAKRLPADTVSSAIIEEISALPDHDDIMAAAIKDAGNVVMGFVSNTSEISQKTMPHLPRRIAVLKGGEGILNTIEQIERPVVNLPEFEQAAAGNGFFSLSPDHDSIIRKINVLKRLPGDGNDTATLLAIEAYRVGFGSSDMRLRRKTEDQLSAYDTEYELIIDKAHRIPIDDGAPFYVHYTPARPNLYIPATDVIHGTVDVSRIRDRIVLVGTSATGLKDIRSTPLNLFAPGVEVHLNVIEQIMQGRYLNRSELIVGMEALFIATVGLFIIVLVPFMNAVLLTFCTLLTITGIASISYWAYLEHGALIDPTYPSLTVFFICGAAVLLSYIRAESERRTVRHAFGLYISPDYMKDLTENPDQLRLGGEIRDISVMFTDVRGFTSISEQLKPDELIQLMNDFLTPMSDMVMSNRGTIDKYMGDAMMAFWNAPILDPEHPRHACITALSMADALKPINDRLASDAAASGKPLLQIKAGIGINSGPGAVGNMGSRQRFAYSVLGDTVNLASRLESQTKAYGVDILIGEATYAAVTDFAALELDLIRVKGKLQPVRIYTLLGDAKAAQESEFHLLKLAHDKMLTLYRAAEFTIALDMIEDCLRHAPAQISGYYAMMRERMEQMRKTPPGSAWDGVFIATSK